MRGVFKTLNKIKKKYPGGRNNLMKKLEYGCLDYNKSSDERSSKPKSKIN